MCRRTSLRRHVSLRYKGNGSKNRLWRGSRNSCCGRHRVGTRENRLCDRIDRCQSNCTRIDQFRHHILQAKLCSLGGSYTPLRLSLQLAQLGSSCRTSSGIARMGSYGKSRAHAQPEGRGAFPLATSNKDLAHRGWLS
jgi:hypothetical protein